MTKDTASELLFKNPSWIAGIKKNAVINFHQDFTASTESNVFKAFIE
jgi:hypothetical protein